MLCEKWNIKFDVLITLRMCAFFAVQSNAALRLHNVIEAMQEREEEEEEEEFESPNSSQLIEGISGEFKIRESGVAIGGELGNIAEFIKGLDKERENKLDFEDVAQNM